MPRQADEVRIGAVISAIWKGVHGSGKSIASCGKAFRPVYVFDFENRMRSVINYYKRLDGHCKDVEFDTFSMGGNFFAVNSRFDELKRNCPYRSVSVASLTSYIHYILKAVNDSKQGQTRQSGQKAGRSIGGIPVNELEDYNAEDSAIIFELVEFLQAIQEQGVNVFLEAHISPYELRDRATETTQTIMQILTKGKKAPAQIPGYFDEMYIFRKKYEGIMIGSQTTHYTASAVGDAMNDTKTALGITEIDFTNADFSELLLAQIPQEVKDAPRVDPNRPKVLSF